MHKKKKRKSKKGVSKEKKPLLPRRIKQNIWGVLMFLLAVIVCLSFFDLAGAGGRGLRLAIHFLLGQAIFALPLIFIIAGLMFFSPKFSNKWAVFLASLILIIGICGLLGTLSQKYQSFEEKAGGWLGYIIALPLLRGFGIWVSLVIFTGVIMVGLLTTKYFLGVKRKKEAAAPASTEPEPLTSSEQAFPEPETESSPGLIKKLFQPKFKVKAIEAKRQEKEREALQAKPLTESEPGEELDSALKRKKQSKYKPPPLKLLEADKGLPTAGDIKNNSILIRKTLQNFDIPVEMSGVHIGPTVTQYTLKPAEGVKLSKITALSNDLALALAAHPIRLEAPIPGKSLVGIEVPNKRRVTVRFKDLFESADFMPGSGLWLAMGRDVAGSPVFVDLTKMPHFLIAGATGTGKTICLNSLIISLLYQHGPDFLRLILVDPKRVEFSVYQGLPHLLSPVIFDAQKTINALKWLIGEMERRFEILSQARTRDIASFNTKIASASMRVAAEQESLPYIVLIIDELADLMAARGKEVEAGIVRLAQMARAVGIHLVVATQRPSVEVITGLIKANITCRTSFRVASQVDSRTVLDAAGAEKLLGEGDMLFLSPETKKPKRIQGCYIAEKEVKRVVRHLQTAEITDESSELGADDLKDELEQALEGEVGAQQGKILYKSEEDPFYDQAKQLVMRAKKASASLLQRHLRIGYARAARLIDMLEANGVVGPAEGAKPRQVYGEEEESPEDVSPT